MNQGRTEQRQHFERLVRKAEHEIAEQPVAYRRKVIAFALLGYGVIFGLLFLLLFLLVGTVWAAIASTAFLILLIKKKLIILIAMLAWVLLKALWVRIHPPTGYALERRRFPDLWREVDALRGALRTPPIHQLVLTEDFNAAIVQTPRLGIFGPYRNTLILGMELLLSLSPEQARAVMAHEFGHLSGNHGRLGGWIYRVRESWFRIMEGFAATEGWLVAPMKKFFRWYAPSFSGYTFVFARHNEYDADSMAAELTSPQTATSALLATMLQSELTDRQFWQGIYAQADEQPSVEPRAFTRLSQYLRREKPDKQEARALFQQIMARQTGHADTHPALADRLKALGPARISFQRAATSAADDWLGDQLPAVIDDFDRTWAEARTEAWQARHRAVQQGRARLAELAGRDSAALSDGECWERAVLTERFVSSDDPLPLYRHYQERCPEDADADYVIGRLLLERGDESGVAHLERAAQHPQLKADACGELYGYFQRTGRPGDAEVWLRRGEQTLDKLDALQAERDVLRKSDTFAPAQVTQEIRDFYTDRLSAYTKITHGWLAQKVVPGTERDGPLLVIVIALKGFVFNEEKLVATIIASMEFPCETFVLTRRGANRAIAKRVVRAGEQLF